MSCDHAPTIVSLFDGIAGFPLAFSRAGCRVVATVEIDKAAAGVTAEHFPDAVHFSDVTKVTARELIDAGFCPLCGIITAGWPCQDLSLAGRRLGLGGARSGLFFEIVRLIEEFAALGVQLDEDLRARWLCLENVPGLLSAVCSCPGSGICGGGCVDPHPVRGGACGPGRCMELHGGAMGAVLGSLAELGYGFAYRVLDARYFGVPQRRRRVVIVANLGDGSAPAEILFEPESGRGDSAQGSETRPGAARGLAPGADRAGVAAVAPTLQGGGRRGYRVDAETAAGGGLVAAGGVVTALTRNGITGLDDNTAQGGQLVTLEPDVWQQQGSKLQGSNSGPVGTLRRGNGNVAGGVPFATHALTSEGADASEDGTGRGTPIIPDEVDLASVRRLTPVECERLQGFPDGWTGVSNGRSQSDAARYRQLGNSVAVPVFEWVARRWRAAADANGTSR